MGLVGCIDAPNGIRESLAVLNRGAFRCADEAVCIWRFHDMQIGLCCDATSAELPQTNLLLLLDGYLFDPEEVANRLGLEKRSYWNHADLLLQACLRFPDDFPLHADGAYSFVLYDGQRRRLVVGSSPTGCNGIFYWQRGNTLRFASEIGALLVCDGVSKDVDETRAARWLTFYNQPDKRTLFRDVQQIQPGEMMIAENGATRFQRYWRPEETRIQHQSDARYYAEGLLDHLQRAVQRRVRNFDVVGSQMSGGLDSSSVSALAAESLASRNRGITSFTAVPSHAFTALPANLFGKGFGDERFHAASVAEMHRNIEHILIPNDAVRFFDALDFFANENLHPSPNVCNGPWFLAIFKEAQRRGIELILSGATGNMTVSYKGIYALHTLLKRLHLKQWVRLIKDRQHIGYSVRDSLAQSIGQGPTALTLRDGLSASLRLLRGQSPTSQNILSMLDISAIRATFFQNVGLPAQLERHIDLIPASSQTLRINALRRAHQNATFVTARRCFGLEYSDPTTDRRLFEYCLSLPEDAFCQNGRPRSLIRDAMQGHLPDTVRLERRKGIQAADAAHLITSNRPQIREELQSLRNSDLANHTLDLPALHRMEEEWSNGQFTDVTMREKYMGKLLAGIAFGRFVRRLEDGSLLASLHQQLRNAEIENYQFIDRA